jgi:hypothetical protein
MVGAWVLSLAFAGLAVAAPAAQLDPSAAPTASTPVSDVAAKWGIEIASVRISAAGNMVDFRYKVIDAGKAASLFERTTKPHLIHQSTGKVLTVPRTAKVGPLRSSDKPQEGRTYWMFFGNLPKLVKPGDKVTVVIGAFKAEDLVVE